MAKDPDNLAGDLGAEKTGGLFTGLIADEDEFDRRTLWRLGSWGFAAVGALTLAMLANQSSLGWRRDQLAATEVARHAQQIQTLAKEGRNETRQLASAIETLNSDRDRLYSRVTSLEQALDSVTGAIAKQTRATAQAPPPPMLQPAWLPVPIVAPVAAAPAVPVAAEKSVRDNKPPAMAVDKPPPESEKPPDKAPAVVAEAVPAAVAPSGNPEAAKAETSPRIASAPQAPAEPPPDPAADKPAEPARPPPASPASEAAAVAAPDGGDEKKDDAVPSGTEVQRTEFGVDLGGANSVAGLRALWRGLLKWHANAPLLGLRPIIVVKEGGNGLGMQLRLVAGPLRDAGAAARICAVLAENKRPCETTLFDGQRLTLNDEPPAAAGAAAKPPPPPPRRRAAPPPPPPKRAAVTPEPEEPPKKPESPAVSAVSALSSLFGRKEQ